MPNEDRRSTEEIVETALASLTALNMALANLALIWERTAKMQSDAASASLESINSMRKGAELITKIFRDIEAIKQ